MAFQIVDALPAEAQALAAPEAPSSPALNPDQPVSADMALGPGFLPSPADMAPVHDQPAEFVILDPHTGAQVPTISQGTPQGLVSSLRSYLGVPPPPKTTPLDIEASRTHVRPYDVRQEVFGTGREEEFQRVVSRGMAGLTGGLTDLMAGEAKNPETMAGAVAGGAAELAGFLLGPMSAARFLTGGVLQPTAGGLQGVVQILTEGGANLGIAGGLSSILPSLLNDNTAKESFYNILQGGASSALVGSLYPAAGFIENVPLRMAVTLAVMDKIRAGPNQFFTFDDFYNAIRKDGPLNADVGKLAFGYLMDMFFAASVPNMRKALEGLRHPVSDSLAGINLEEAQKAILGLTEKGDVAPPPEPFATPKEVDAQFGGPDEFNKAYAQTQEKPAPPKGPYVIKPRVIRPYTAPGEPVPEGSRAIQENLAGQLEAAGYHRENAALSARQMTAAFTAMAGRAGMEPQALFDRYGVEIRRAPAAPPAGAIENVSLPFVPRAAPEGAPGSPAPAAAPGEDFLSPMLDRLRNEAAGRMPERVPGAPSLLDFIRNHGGVQDDQGDVKALDPNFGRKPFQRNILRTAEQGARKLDDMVGLAKEAGYIGEHDKNALLDAMDKELRGTKVYPISEADQMLAGAERADLAQLSDYLKQNGLDVRTMSNDEVKAALDKLYIPSPLAANQPVNAAEYFQGAFHGSPHAFEKFDLTKIGTGEGAQSYGWGLYFAGRKEVAKFYRDKLSNVVRYEGKVVERLNDMGNPDFAFSEAVHALFDFGGDKERALEFQNESGLPPKMVGHIQAEIRKLDYSKISTHGRLYHVDIPPDDTFLAWDKQVPTEQLAQIPERVRLYLDRFLEDHTELSISELTGRELYQLFVNDAMEGGGITHDLVPGSENMQPQEQVSRFLAEHGFSGIRYLDQASRGKGEGSYNYVVFDDKLINIVKMEQAGGAGGPQGPRGAISVSIPDPLNPGRKVSIELSRTADLSTFLHESGHLYTVMLQDLAREMRALPPENLSGSQRQIIADEQTLLSWLGVPGWKDAGTAEYEKLARGFEAYLMEGKAPSEALRSAFARFKDWLLGVYRSVKSLGVELNPKVRAVFDRMLATEEEIAAAPPKETPPTGLPTISDAPLTPAQLKNAAKVEAMFNRADSELQALRSTSLKSVMARLKHLTVDTSATVKKSLLEQSGELGKQAVMMHDVIAGSGAFTDYLYNEAAGRIYDGLSKTDEILLNRLIQSRRTVVVEANAARRGEPIQSPGGLGVTEHTAYLRALQKSDPELYQALNARADAYFAEMRKMLDALHAAGLLTDEAYKAISGSGDYSPRQFLEYIDPGSTSEFGGKTISVSDTGISSLSRAEAAPPAGAGKTISVPDSGVKRLEGGSVQSLENNSRLLLSQAIARTQGRIARNQANLALLELARSDPANGVVRAEGSPGDFAAPGEETLHVVEKGQTVRLFMPRELANEWVESDPMISRQAANILGWISGANLLRPLATGLNPEFALRNLPRDMALVWMATGEFSPHLPLALGQFAKDYAATFHDARTHSGAYVDYLREGGGMSFLTHQGRISGGAEGVVGKIQDVMGRLGEVSEIWTRLALRNRAIANGKAPQEATWIARNYLDFHQGGAFTKAMDSAFPYFNASVQGTRSLVNAAIQDPAVFSYKVAQLGTLAAGLYLANRSINKDAWEAISAREKASYFILTTPLKITDNQGNTRWLYFKIAKDQGQRVFASIFEGLMAKSLGDRVDGDQIAQAAQDFLPIIPGTVLPPTVSAFMGYMANKDFWRNEDAWKGPKVAAGEEYTNYTQPALREFGKATGLSPTRTGLVLNQFSAANNMFTALVGAGLARIFQTQNEAERTSSTEQIVRDMPLARTVFAFTDPFAPFKKQIEDIKIDNQTEVFKRTRALDELSEGFYRDRKAGAPLPEMEQRHAQIMGFIAQSPPEYQENLIKRFADYGTVYEIPDRRFWLDVKNMTPEAAATTVWMRALQSPPSERLAMDAAMKQIPGIITPKFLLRLEQLKKKQPLPDVPERTVAPGAPPSAAQAVLDSIVAQLQNLFGKKVK